MVFKFVFILISPCWTLVVSIFNLDLCMKGHATRFCS